MRYKTFHTFVTAALMLFLSAGLKAQIVKKASMHAARSVSFMTEADPLGKKLFEIRNKERELFSAYIADISHELDNDKVASTTQVTYTYKFGNSNPAFLSIKKSGFGKGETEIFGLSGLKKGIYENFPLEKFSRKTDKDLDESHTDMVIELFSQDGKSMELPLDSEVIKIFSEANNYYSNLANTLANNTRGNSNNMFTPCGFLSDLWDWLTGTCEGAITTAVVVIAFEIWDPFGWFDGMIFFRVDSIIKNCF